MDMSTPTQFRRIAMTRFAVRWRDMLSSLGLLLGYGLSFVALHHAAEFWGFGAPYSFWFPAAGLRFALLWQMGARMAPAAAIAEMVAELATGELVLGRIPLFGLIGVVGPTLVYGVVIHEVRQLAGRRTPVLRFAPLPFALSALIAPVCACVTSLPWAISNGAASDLHALVLALVSFSLGDILGVLILTPPLIWIADRISSGKPWDISFPRSLPVIESLFLTAAAWGVVLVIRWAGFGLQIAPVLLSTCWIGLRCGRVGAWGSIIFSAAIVLPITGGVTNVSDAMGLHLLLASIAAVGYLTGSFAEAEAQSQATIAQRDRLLFQAERLKTLRAMSVAVIHEISQPLSTIAIEAHHLAAASADGTISPLEISDTAGLIARKAEDLARMVRRLRRFGGRTADEPSSLPISLLLADVLDISAPEAKANGVRLDVAPPPDINVHGHDIELRQVLLNLLRNAIAASPRGAPVEIRCFRLGDMAHVIIENEDASRLTERTGMGVGLIIARSIAEAHGGRVNQEHPFPGKVRFVLTLPISEATHV